MLPEIIIYISFFLNDATWANYRRICKLIHSETAKSANWRKSRYIQSLVNEWVLHKNWSSAAAHLDYYFDGYLAVDKVLILGLTLRGIEDTADIRMVSHTPYTELLQSVCNNPLSFTNTSPNINIEFYIKDRSETDVSYPPIWRPKNPVSIHLSISSCKNIMLQLTIYPKDLITLRIYKQDNQYSHGTELAYYKNMNVYNDYDIKTNSIWEVADGCVKLVGRFEDRGWWSEFVYSKKMDSRKSIE
jgi:hypothetical protein